MEHKNQKIKEADTDLDVEQVTVVQGEGPRCSLIQLTASAKVMSHDEA